MTKLYTEVEKNKNFKDFPGGPGVKTFHSQGKGLIPGQGTGSHKLQQRSRTTQLKPGTVKKFSENK